MATITVRALDKNGDPLRGSGLGSFFTDIEAVAQIIGTRLRLLQGEWFLNQSDGTPVFQSLLGHPTTTEAVALILRQRILGTPYVISIQSLQVVYGKAGRTFAFFATVLTQFGVINVTTVAPSNRPANLSLATLTDKQLTALTDAQLASMTN